MSGRTEDMELAGDIHKLAFKFRKLDERLNDLLQHRELYFAKPTAFNDPFDCDVDVATHGDTAVLHTILNDCTSLAHSRVSKALLFWSRYEEDRSSVFGGRSPDLLGAESFVPRQWDAAHSPFEKQLRTLLREFWVAIADSAEIDVGRHERELRKFAEQVSNLLQAHVGICCLARNISSALMWSHYADRHTGVALGFDLADRLFVKQCGIVHRDVRYTSSPEIDGDKGKQPAHLFSQLFTTKAVDWQYENETRYVSFTGAGNYVFKRNALRAIVLGCRFADHFSNPDGQRLVQRLREFVHAENRRRNKGAKIHVYHAYKIARKFAVGVRRIDDVRVAFDPRSFAPA